MHTSATEIIIGVLAISCLASLLLFAMSIVVYVRRLNRLLDAADSRREVVEDAMLARLGLAKQEEVVTQESQRLAPRERVAPRDWRTPDTNVTIGAGAPVAQGDPNEHEEEALDEDIEGLVAKMRASYDRVEDGDGALFEAVREGDK